MATPHDALFRQTFGDPAHAGPLLRCLLPPAVVAAIWCISGGAPGAAAATSGRSWT